MNEQMNKRKLIYGVGSAHLKLNDISYSPIILLIVCLILHFGQMLACMLLGISIDLCPVHLAMSVQDCSLTINRTRRASSVSNSNFFYKTEGWRVKDGG